MNRLKSLAHRTLGHRVPFLLDPAMEGTYRHLFLRDLDRVGQADIWYPVGGAANYSLLYMLLRVCREFRPKSALDIGAGQSSMLWSMMQSHGLVGTVLTLEDNANWGELVRCKVEHDVLVTPLVRSSVEGRSITSYNWPEVVRRGPFEIIVNDGPRGTPRYSRLGVMNLINETLPPDFVIIVDDAERRGEQDMIKAIHVRLKQLDRRYVANEVRAAKCQAVFAGGRYTEAAFF